MGHVCSLELCVEFGEFDERGALGKWGNGAMGCVLVTKQG